MVVLSELDEVQQFIVSHLAGNNEGELLFEVKRAVGREWRRRYPRWYHFFKWIPAVFAAASQLQAQGVVAARWGEPSTFGGRPRKIIWLTPHGDRLAAQLTKQPDA